jgi:hypothetical protein
MGIVARADRLMLGAGGLSRLARSTPCGGHGDTTVGGVAPMPSNTARPPPADRSDRPPGHGPGSPGGASGIVPAPPTTSACPTPRNVPESPVKEFAMPKPAPDLLTRIHEISAIREEVAAIHAEAGARKTEPQPAALDALNKE